MRSVPEAAFSLTPRPLDRLSAFRRYDRLDARCVRCGHVQRLDPMFLRRRYGDLDMAALRARLCCVECGGRRRFAVRLTEALPPRPEIPPA